MIGLLTTVCEVYRRVSMHAVREHLLRAQAASVGLPLWQVEIPSPCSDIEYRSAMRHAMDHARREAVAAVAFGDLFLEDVRRYREERMLEADIEALFPLWGMPTAELGRAVVANGLKARVTCLDPKLLSPSLAGRCYDNAFLDELPPAVDPCGERGEFHTFAYDGPMFSSPIRTARGEVVKRDGFVFADLLPVVENGEVDHLETARLGG